MASPRAWLLSLCMAGGVVGGGALALQAAPGTPAAAKASAPVAETQHLPSASRLDAEIKRLLTQDKSLRAALAEARRQLDAELVGAPPAGPVSAPVSAPTAVRVRVHRVPNAAPAAAPPAAAPDPAPPAPTPTHVTTPPSRGSQDPPVFAPSPTPPPSHGTTGASGAGGGHGDDNGGDDHGGGGGDD